MVKNTSRRLFGNIGKTDVDQKDRLLTVNARSLIEFLWELGPYGKNHKDQKNDTEGEDSLNDSFLPRR